MCQYVPNPSFNRKTVATASPGSGGQRSKRPAPAGGTWHILPKRHRPKKRETKNTPQGLAEAAAQLSMRASSSSQMLCLLERSCTCKSYSHVRSLMSWVQRPPEPERPDIPSEKTRMMPCFPSFHSSPVGPSMNKLLRACSENSTVHLKRPAFDALGEFSTLGLVQ